MSDDKSTDAWKNPEAYDAFMAWLIYAGTGQERPAPCAPSGTGGCSSSFWGDTELRLAMSLLSNGLRCCEAGAIARRDLSEAVRPLRH